MRDSKFQAVDQLIEFFEMIIRRILKLLFNEFFILQAYKFGSFDHNKLQINRTHW